MKKKAKSPMWPLRRIRVCSGDAFGRFGGDHDVVVVMHQADARRVTVRRASSGREMTIQTTSLQEQWRRCGMTETKRAHRALATILARRAKAASARKA